MRHVTHVNRIKLLKGWGDTLETSMHTGSTHVPDSSGAPPVFAPPAWTAAADLSKRLWGARAASAPSELLVPPPPSVAPVIASATLRASGPPHRPQPCAGVGLPTSACATSPAHSFMSPLFHLTTQDAAIVAMEHNNHYKLLALATSSLEVYVTLTKAMPVIENQGVTLVPSSEEAERGYNGKAGAPLARSSPVHVPVQEPPPPPVNRGPLGLAFLDERLHRWDPLAMSKLVDRLRHPCTQLLWAPWQHGVFLAVLCQGRGVRLYRYAHGRWGLDEAVDDPDVTAMTFSPFFTLATVGTQGRVQLLARRPAAAAEGSTAPSNTWTVTSAHALEESVPVSPFLEVAGERGRNDPEGVDRGAPPRSEENVSSSPSHNRGLHNSARDFLCVDFDDSGTLLAAGGQDGAVRVYAVTLDGTRLDQQAYTLEGRYGACRQVAWSPSAGRSFLALALVYGSTIKIILFRRPRYMRSAVHPMVGQQRGGPQGGASQQSSAAAVALTVLTLTTAHCEGIVKLSWNTTGTRLVTAHTDSAVRVWAVEVTYQQPSTTSVGGAASSASGAPAHSMEPKSEDASVAGATGHETVPHGRNQHHLPTTKEATEERKLLLCVSLRKVSSVHPYHEVGVRQ